MMKIFLITTLVWVSARCDSDGVICEMVRGICCDETGRHGRQQGILQERGPPGIPGRPGKAGPRGIPGRQGLPGIGGLPGMNASLDYQRVSEIIQRKIQQG